MAKIVLSAAGSAGDIYPIVALAIELRRRGHLPVIATQAEFRDEIEAEGLAFRAVRPSQAEIESELGVDTAELVRLTTRPRAGLAFAVRHIAMPFLRRAYQDMRAISVGADLVITHPSAFAARLAAEKLEIPWLSLTLAPFAFMSESDAPQLLASSTLMQARRVLGPGFDRRILQLLKLAAAPWTRDYQVLREELGLPPQKNPLFEGQFSALGALALCSPLFAPAASNLPLSTHVTGFCHYEGARAVRTMPEALEQFLHAGLRPLVFTLGSALIHQPRAFFQVAAEVSRRLGLRAVMLVGPDSPLGPAQASESLFISRAFVPHGLIFPRASIVVHHGGIGTTAEALRAGVPQLVAPFFADQPDNASRVERLGVGRSLPIEKFTNGRVMRELGRISGSAYEDKARQVAALLATENGPARAADVIEAVLAAQFGPVRERAFA